MSQKKKARCCIGESGVWFIVTGQCNGGFMWPLPGAAGAREQPHLYTMGNGGISDAFTKDDTAL